MSAAALMAWLGEHRSDVLAQVRSYANRADFYRFMAEFAGVQDYFSGDHERACAAYLEALKRRYPNAQGKPAPQLPPEIWNPNKVDAGRAWAAVVAMCGGV